MEKRFDIQLNIIKKIASSLEIQGQVQGQVHGQVQGQVQLNSQGLTIETSSAFELHIVNLAKFKLRNDPSN